MVKAIAGRLAYVFRFGVSGGVKTGKKKILPKWELQLLDQGGKIRLGHPWWAIRTATWYAYSVHSNLDFWDPLFPPCNNAGLWSLCCTNASVPWWAQDSSFHEPKHTFITLQITHLSSKRNMKRGEKIEKDRLTVAQKVLGERERVSLWLAVIWIKVHSEVVNDLNSKTCYYNWSKNGLKKSLFHKTLFVRGNFELSRIHYMSWVSCS